jgi:hypothetical protein
MQYSCSTHLVLQVSDSIIRILLEGLLELLLDVQQHLGLLLGQLASVLALVVA